MTISYDSSRHSELGSSTRLRAVATMAVAGALLLAGCSAGEDEVNESLSVADAKRTTQEMELELASFVPEDATASVEQDGEGVFLGCGEDRAVPWTGQTKVVLQNEADPEAIVESVVADYINRDPYTAQLETADDGYLSAHVLGPHGSGWLVTPSAELTTMEILSFSPCFRLPEDIHPSDTY
jgi:hypothetical protein